MPSVSLLVCLNICRSDNPPRTFQKVAWTDFLLLRQTAKPPCRINPEVSHKSTFHINYLLPIGAYCLCSNKV
eukprot:scaffold130408_cov70-Attheya_sp.AAC.1